MLKEHLQFIQDNHQILSSREIGRRLNISYQTVLYNAKKHNIKFSRHLDNGNIEQFKNITNSKIAYFLGFCWADASFSYYHKKKTCTNITIELKKVDCDYLESVIKDLFILNRYERNRTNRQPQKSITISDTVLANYLFYDLEFRNKSSCLPTVLLKKIPTEISHYFWLGYFDGDGHIGANDARLEFCGNYNFDWNTLYNLFGNIGISKYTYRQYIGSKTQHKFSSIRCQKSESIKFYNYIYQSYNSDKIGLPRKYNTYKEIFIKDQSIF